MSVGVRVETSEFMYPPFYRSISAIFLLLLWISTEAGDVLGGIKSSILECLDLSRSPRSGTARDFSCC